MCTGRSHLQRGGPVGAALPPMTPEPKLNTHFVGFPVSMVTRTPEANISSGENHVITHTRVPFLIMTEPL